MSKELYKYIEQSTDKIENLPEAEVINFPSDKKIKILVDRNNVTYDFWNIRDISNDDQYKAITGIGFMLTTLIILGLYSIFF